MIELIFVACLAGSPPECRERRLLYADMPLTACMLQAQGELAQWTEAHPAWAVRHWACRPAGRGTRGA